MASQPSAKPPSTYDPFIFSKAAYLNSGSPDGVRRLSYHPPAPYPSVTHVRPPTAIISQVPPSGVRTIPRGGYITRQHPGLMPSSFARHGYGSAQALNYHPHQQMQAQLGAAGQMFLPPSTGGSPPGEPTRYRCISPLITQSSALLTRRVAEKHIRCPQISAYPWLLHLSI
ncbi:hypothetical protein BC827DRAFT_319027 [Russula dissimulans]|nr:hypothetical protein BC827DRAFT_319027 [Russula dissimulans]